MGSKRFAGGAVAVVMAALCGAASAQDQPTGSWSAETAGTQFRYGGTASDGTYFYTFGGPSNLNSYRSTRRYDPATNVWSDLALLPTQVQWNAGAFHNGRLFSFGNSYYGTGAIYMYTISSNSWTTLSPVLTSNRSQASAATLGDLIYIAGGNYGAVSNQLDQFDPVALTITPRATMPGAVYRNAVTAIPSLSKLYSFCGLNANGQYQAVAYEYTPADNTWVTRAPMAWNAVQQVRQGPVAFTLGNRAYVVGGYTGQQYSSMTLEYNPMNDAWIRRADMLTTRAFHGGAVAGGKAYIHGGEPSYTPCEEFTPPVFGSAPFAPADIGQSGSQADSALQAQADPGQRDGWTNNQVTFSATVTDPDANQQVRLRVRVKPATAPAWNNAPVLDSGLGPQGLRTIAYAIPATGEFDWQYRVEDAYANSYPEGAAWADAFGNPSTPDFRSDQSPPSEPIALAPDRVDIQVDSASGGPVTLRWTEATDNGPTSGISYEIQVAVDGGFNGIEAQLFSPSGIDTTDVTLGVSRYDKFWRLRARDVGGNLSDWSQPLPFRVTWDDGINHGSGDAKSGCGLSAAAGGSPSPVILAGLAVLLGGMRRPVWGRRLPR